MAKGIPGPLGPGRRGRRHRVALTLLKRVVPIG